MLDTSKLIVDHTLSTFGGQGSVMLAPRWLPSRIYGHLGNTPGAELSQKITKKAFKESQTGKRQTVGYRITEREGELALKIQAFRKNLDLILNGLTFSKAAGTVTEEALPAGLVVGNIVGLQNMGVSELVIKDSAAQPATLVEGKHYEYSVHGGIRFLDVAGFTQPFKADYKYEATESSTVMSGGLREYAVRIEGLNADDGEPVLIELWRVGGDPVDKLALISDDTEVFDLKLPLMADLSRPAEGPLGQFGRITFLKK
ncbi:phage tail tube protein [Chitinimonas lacunae]|uniref:Glycosyl hydrolase family 98 putative carbohydrate-binding module domain-containing protein n=1 Tax=Chitinimonas lacunae TaxID=1963018 RepID=A0ABV8MXC2_9NEIS